jgi:hypothetical protein
VAKEINFHSDKSKLTNVFMNTKKLIFFASLSVTILLVACGAGLGSTSACLDIGGAGGSSACSNSSSSTSPYVGTGSATMGAPMSYANIVIQPLGSNSQPLTTKADINGAFEIKNISSFPILVTATSTSGESVQYGYIKSSSQTTVAANPITTLVITLANNGNPDSITTPLSDNAINQAHADAKVVLNKFLLEVGEANTNDFTAKIFNTDHTGLDLLLDSLGFSINANGKTIITNRLTGIQKQIDRNNLTEIQLEESSKLILRQLPLSLCSNMLTSLTSDQLINDDSLFSPDFLLNGATKTVVRETISNLSADGQIIITTPSFNGLDENENLVFDLSILKSSNKKYIGKLSAAVQKINGQNSCVFIGNQLPFRISVEPTVRSMIRLDGYTNNTTNKMYGVGISVGAYYSDYYTSNHINGVLIRSAKVEVCDRNDSCQLLAKLQNSETRATFSIQENNTPHNILANPSFSLFTDTATPIKISLFSSATAPTIGNVGLLKVTRTRAVGDLFTSAEVEKIVMPTITNSSAITDASNSGSITNIVNLNFNSGSGIVSYSSALSEGNGLFISNEGPLILKKGTGSFTMELTNPTNIGYRSLTINAPQLNRPGAVETKYLWSPNCNGCY